jgi:cation diffusion facilitator CzcD-associated flavoprotein CzcO
MTLDESRRSAADSDHISDDKMREPDRSSMHAIIGAGFSGLGVASAFKRRGIPFELLEADDDIGGNWYHGVYDSVHIISSRKTTEYGDWPMPADWPDFPSAAQMLSYLRNYAEHHGLRDHLRTRTRVTDVRPLPGDKWQVTVEGRAPVTYAGVVVCNGHHWDRRMPERPGTLSAEMIHSKDYKTAAQLRGKRVLVIGGGNSACDIAVEAGRVGASAHISLRRGYWFLPKTMLGVPMVELMTPWMPARLQRALIKTLARIIVGDYRRYGLQQPDHEPFEHHPTINSELLLSIRHGRIKPHSDVASWDGKTVHFTDGTQTDVDLVVAATGYHVSFPFVADGVVKWKRGMPQLISSVLPPGQRNIYFFGFSQPRYGAGPLITAGAELLADFVQVQPRLTHPLGDILRRLGVPAPRSYLQDPFATLRRIRSGRLIAPRLPFIERLVLPCADRRGRGPGGLVMRRAKRYETV